MKVIRGYKYYFCTLVLLICVLAFLYAILKDDRTPVKFGSDFQIVKTFSKTSSKENLPYHFFDDQNVYSIKTETIYDQTNSHKELITSARIIAGHYLNTYQNKFKYGQYRMVGNGIELDLHYSHSGGLDFKKVSFFYPYGSPRIMFRHTERNPLETVHIILPLKGKSRALEIFADNIVQNIYPTDDRITLTVISFRDKAEADAKVTLQEKFASIPKFNWTFLSTDDSVFSRGKGIQIGIKFTQRLSSDLLFFCDVDIIMRPNFFRRCRTNTVQKQQVYYPVVFSLYNPELVYGPQTLNATPILEIKQDNGFWRAFGFGMVCLYKDDFDAVGGVPDFKRWGGEDKALFDKISTSNSIEYIRAPDPDLFHIYHRKQCSALSYESRKDCIKSKIFTEGSQLQMGVALFKLTEDLDVAGLFNNSRGISLVILILLIASLFLNMVALLWIIKTSVENRSQVNYGLDKVSLLRDLTAEQ